MFEILPQSTGKVIGIRTNGKLLHADYQEMIPKLEALISQYGSIRCYIEMVDFGGVELRALWDELKFDTRRGGHIERCAVVGDRAWEHWATNLFKPFFYRAHLKYFDVSKNEEAWQWLNEGLETTTGCGCHCETEQHTTT